MLSIGSAFDDLQEDPQAGYKYSVEFCGGTLVTVQQFYVVIVDFAVVRNATLNDESTERSTRRESVKSH